MDTKTQAMTPETPSLTPEQRAPVQGYQQGIPWWMHLKAYDVYCNRFGKQQALIEGCCRGGFHISELDMFIPGWRDELDYVKQLETRALSAEADNARLRGVLERCRKALSADAKPGDVFGAFQEAAAILSRP